MMSKAEFGINIIDVYLNYIMDLKRAIIGDFSIYKLQFYSII